MNEWKEHFVLRTQPRGLFLASLWQSHTFLESIRPLNSESNRNLHCLWLFPSLFRFFFFFLILFLLFLSLRPPFLFRSCSTGIFSVWKKKKKKKRYRVARCNWHDWSFINCRSAYQFRFYCRWLCSSSCWPKLSRPHRSWYRFSVNSSFSPWS
mgnify:CR=1 FL=1